MNASSLDSADLVYSSDSMPGIRRIADNSGFRYEYSTGKPVHRQSDLERIRSLAIPPAYADVWICEDPRGHLQATGRDARGRKQYRYHPLFRDVQEQSKFHRTVEFGQALPAIRSAVEADLRLRGVPKRKVLAVVVSLLDRTLIRVGNEEYAKENHSFGLTTLRTRHVKVDGASLRFRFPGKSKVRHDIEVHDKRLARLVAKIEDLPGQELFHYLDDEGSPRAVTSADVNEYLREIGSVEFSAKDFRTWWGTVLALEALSEAECPKSDRIARRAISTAVKSVAAKLGNTPAICRKCYVHPEVFHAFRCGELQQALSHEPGKLSGTEEAVLCLLRRAENATSE